ncbi:decaprenyl-phosphate phosphoribosyltransferase [Bacillus mycoides]|uniref:decaprenyl-phosphate phosphoribosyltransferase n=1 Tax=Bacillus mycoides TaxID=1405 RepID=UPI002112C923|nr:decaprenyl-phosphate phosphoribosyltransferase [Bacillus mycoides]MCQ6531112.1 decaprenyl-phosphate phosphoribosyltransferase [Bacillus mycoides]
MQIEKAAPKSILLLLLKQLRPKQWTKNLLIFAALVFSVNQASLIMVIQALVCFALFCVVSGCVYILNDFMDIEADRKHPVKRYRPMASGGLNPFVAITVGCIILVVSLIVSSLLNPLLCLVLVIYFTLNVAYSIRLKHVVIIDILIIASGFVLRALAGGLVIHLPFTPWFLLCTLLISLFLAINKRRHELVLLQDNKGSHRKVLESYSAVLLDQLSTIVTSATIVTYAIFTFNAGKTIHLMWTIPFVIYGIFRYLYLVHMEDKGGEPDKVLLEDRHILVTVLLYAITVIIILLNF